MTADLNHKNARLRETINQLVESHPEREVTVVRDALRRNGPQIRPRRGCRLVPSALEFTRGSLRCAFLVTLVVADSRQDGLCGGGRKADASQGRQARGGVWVFARRSIEPEQFRLGRQRSPLAQADGDRMDAIVVGIDVSKDRLDVAVRPTGETFAVERDAEGLEPAGSPGSRRSSPAGDRGRGDRRL